MLHRKIIFSLLLIITATTACDFTLGGVPQLKTGATQTTPINVPAPAANIVTNLTLQVGAAELDLSGGSSKLIEGVIQTNVAEWKPTITISGTRVIIAQGKSDVFLTDSTNTINKWNLQLGKTSPISLTVDAGAYKGTLNLGGVPLRALKIEQGAATSNIKFASLNPEVMRELLVETGASAMSFMGLANANFEKLIFKGGVSNYTLDFSGKLQRNATAKVQIGAATLTLIVPEGTNAKVMLSGGPRAVNPEGAWKKDGDNYMLTGVGPVLTLEVEMGLGSLQLKNKP
jgi:hypothetical protein